MVTILPRNFKSPRANKLENITLRGFGGGWNAVDTDLAMESTFLPTCRNMRRTPGGTQRIRFGSKWFADLSDVTQGVTVDMIYFSACVLVVSSVGHVVCVDGVGAKTRIWDSTIAAALPGAPAGWSGGLNSVNFVPFKNEMIIHNGVDKPITVSRTLVVTYLQDLATGSNVNVPIGRYGCVVSNYHCVAGLAANPTLIYISSVGTAGTFPNDPAPNDSITVDVGAFAPQGAVEIRGIAGFRSNLLVFFQDQTVIVRLGTYNAAGVHTPVFPDTMPTFGVLGHRCIAPVENDLLFSGLSGMTTAKRNLLSVSGTLESTSLSERIEPEYRRTVGVLTDEQQLRECFMVYDRLTHSMLVFTPVDRVFVYSFNDKLRYAAWSEYGDLNVRAACASFLGRIFYADGLRIYQHGNSVYDGEEFFADRIDDRDKVWTPSTFFSEGEKVLDSSSSVVYICLISHISGNGTFEQDRDLLPRWEEYMGEPISFEMELPWLDSKDPMRVKQLRFLSLATKGVSRFFVDAYVDNLFEDIDGNRVFSPALSMEFMGNDAPGAGFDAGPFGGGRRSNDPRLFKFPVKFKTLKLILRGEEGGDLEIVNMSFLFSRGRYRR